MKQIDTINLENNASIIESMKSYNEEDFNLYVAELGRNDWMNEFLEDEEDEEITEKTNQKVNDFLIKLWKIAFNN